MKKKLVTARLRLMGLIGILAAFNTSLARSEPIDCQHKSSTQKKAECLQKAKSQYIEVGIIILPSTKVAQETQKLTAEISKELKERISHQPLSYKNIPHISLYQGKIERKNLSAVQKRLKQIAADTQPFSIQLQHTLSNAGDSIYWNANLDKNLEQLHNRVVDEFSLFTKGLRMRQVEDMPENALNVSQKNKLEKYGIFWIKESFTPHLTIFYNAKAYPALYSIVRQVRPDTSATGFEIKNLAVAELGYEGNVEKILAVYETGS